MTVMGKMSRTLSRRIVASKMEFLLEHRNYLQTFVDETDQVLQLATSWLRNEDTTKCFTSSDMNKMIEDKLAFLLSKDFSAGCEEAAMEQEAGAARSFPSASKSSTDQPLPAGHVHVSGVTEELKTVLNQVNAMQEAMSFFSTSSKMLSEKQLAIEKLVRSLSDKYSKVEQKKLREIDRELESIKGKHKKVALYLDKRMTSFGKRCQRVETKLDTICDQMTDLLPKFSQVEQVTQRQAVGFFAQLIFQPTESLKNNEALIFNRVTFNHGEHYDSETGKFTASLDGLYAVYLSVDTCLKNSYKSYFTIVKQPCLCGDLCGECVCGTVRLRSGMIQASTFDLVQMNADDQIFVKLTRCSGTKETEIYISTFVCFKIF